MRSRRPSGAAESENGCASSQWPRARKRQRSDWPAQRAQPVEIAPADLDRDDARRLLDDALDAQAVAQRARDGQQHPEGDEHRTVAAYSAHQYARATGWRWNSWPVASWWLKASAMAT